MHRSNVDAEGVATKYLDSYPGWRRLIDRDSSYAVPARYHGRCYVGRYVSPEQSIEVAVNSDREGWLEKSRIRR
jgi:hypothetical protein